MNEEPIYPSRRAARKYKPLPKKVKRAIRRRKPSEFVKIERQLKKATKNDHT